MGDDGGVDVVGRGDVNAPPPMHRPMHGPNCLSTKSPICPRVGTHWHYMILLLGIDGDPEALPMLPSKGRQIGVPPRDSLMRRVFDI